MPVKPRRRGYGGSQNKSHLEPEVVESGDIMDLTDYSKLEEAEGFLGAEDLNLELEEELIDQRVSLLDEEGFETIVEAKDVRPGYGQVITRDLKVTRMQSFNARGEEVEFKGIAPQAPIEYVELPVRQSVIDNCAKLAAQHPHANDAQKALELQAEVRRMREQMRLDAHQKEAALARKAAADAAEAAKAKLRAQRIGRLG
jgi:hypothetical protein